MHDELTKLGAKVTEEDDGLIIHSGSKLHGGKVSGHKDHRIIMALSILGVLIDGIEIDDTKHASVTFPTFFTLLNEVREETGI